MRRGFLTVPPPKKLERTTTPHKALHVIETDKLTIPVFVHIPNTKIFNIRQKPDDTLIPNIPADFRVFDFDHIPHPSPGSGETASLCVLYPGTKEAILALPDFPQRHVDPPPTSWPFEIKDLPGMGKGMVARIPIQAGQLILNERPLILYPTEFPLYTDPAVKPEFRDFMHVSAHMLWGPFQKIFYSLHNCKGSEVTKTKGIFETNAIGIGVLPGPYKGTHAVVCHFISRINHSCTPNSEPIWDLVSMSFSIRALRDIQPNEQITIPYDDVYRPRERRQKSLLFRYKFLCACPSCALSDAESARSDIRRALLLIETHKADSLRDDRPLREWASNPSLPGDHIIKHSQKILGMMEDEGLYDEEIWSVHYARLCKVYCALGDREAAREWAKKGAVMMTAFTGNDGGWNNVVDDPEKTEWWGLRLD